MKSIYKYIFLSFTTIFCMASFCDDGTFTFDIAMQNNSEENIDVYFTISSENKFQSPYDAFKMYGYADTLIKANEIRNIYGAYDPDVKLTHFIIILKQSTLEKYTRKELADNNIYDKLYVLSYDDLKALNFHIIYTGD